MAAILALSSGCGGGAVSGAVGLDAGTSVSTVDATTGAADARAQPPPATDGAADGSADGGGAAATWTWIYTQMLANPAYPSSCVGGPCHDPGKEHGLDLSSADTGYLTMRPMLVPGAPQSSKVVGVLESGAMPQGRQRMPAADLDLVRAWITAGAPDD
jgi:hypothetical protein